MLYHQIKSSYVPAVEEYLKDHIHILSCLLHGTFVYLNCFDLSNTIAHTRDTDTDYRCLISCDLENFIILLGFRLVWLF